VDGDTVGKTSVGKTGVGNSTIDSDSAMGKTVVGNSTVGKTINGNTIVGSNGGGVDGSGGSGGNSNSSVSGDNGGGVGGDNRGGGVVGVGGSVDVGLLNHLVDGVNLVGSGNRHGTGHGNLIGGGHVLVDNDLTLDGDGHIHGHINVVLVHLQLGHDVGLDRGDSGVGAHGGSNLPDGDGVSGSRSSGDGGRGDDSLGGRHMGKDRGGQGTGLNQVLGLTGNIRAGGLGDHLLVGLHILVAGLHLLGADLHGLVADNTVLDMLLHDGRASSVAVVSLADSDWGRHVGADVVSSWQSQVAGGTIGTRNDGQGDHKSVHLGLCSEETGDWQSSKSFYTQYTPQLPRFM